MKDATKARKPARAKASTALTVVPSTPAFLAQQAAKPKAEPKAKLAIEDRKNGIVPAKYLGAYVRTKIEPGVTVVDNGDTTATALRGLELDEVYAYAADALATPEATLRTKYGHLNAGQQRMNLGNRIRGEIARQARKAIAQAAEIKALLEVAQAKAA